MFLYTFGYIWVTEWPTIGKTAAHSAYYMFSLYKYLTVNLVFSLRFSECEFFLIAPFPDYCLLLLFYIIIFLGFLHSLLSLLDTCMSRHLFISYAVDILLLFTSIGR